MSDKDYNTQSFTNDQCFDKTEDGDGGNDNSKIIQDNASSILGDVCSIPDMHNDEVKMNVEQDVFAADKSADNVHSEDEREDCPIPNLESRNGSRKNTLGSVSSEGADEHDDFENKKINIKSDLIATKSEDAYHENQTEKLCHKESFQLKEEKELDVSLEKLENNEFEVVSQNADLSNKQEDNEVCFKPEIDTEGQIDVARDEISSNNDNDESEDIIMKESMVTNVSEGRPADFGFELSDNIEHDTKDDSPTMQTEFFEKSEIAQENGMGAFSEQTSFKIESNEYCYQRNENTSLDLASLNSQVPAGQLSSVEIVENAAVSSVDENLMVDNMSNIKETEFLVETSTNLASSQEPSEIFSQNDEHMAQKVSEFGVNGEYENSKDIDETNNCLEDNATKDTSVEILNPVEIEPLISDNGMPVNDPKEIYENTTFELNSVEKDSVFDQQKIHKDAEYQPNIGDMISGSQHVDNDSKTPNFDKDTYNELVIKNSVEPYNDTNKTTEEDIVKETECLDTKTAKPEIENLEQVKVNELESQSENNASDGYESSAQAENKEFIEDLEKRAEDEVTTQVEPKIETITNVQPIFVEEFKKETLEIENHQTEGVNLLVEAENDSLPENSNIMESVSDQQSTLTELPMENENVTEKVSEIDLQTGIQDSEPAIEIETTKEPQVETHLTSQELNANTAQQNIETTEEVKTETADSTLEPTFISVPVVVPVEETKKVSETKTESAPIKKAASKPAPKTANATKTPGSASKPSKTSAPTSSLRKSDAPKASPKSTTRPTASTPKAAIPKAGTAGGPASAPRRSVPPAKLNTTAPKTTAGSATSANASKPGTTTKPQTNGAARPTSASTRPTTRPASARPQTAKTSSAPAKTPSSRPATAGSAKTPTTARTPLSTRTTPLTRPSPIPSTLKPRTTSTSSLRAAS